MRIIHFLNHSRRANGHVELAVDLACEQAAQGNEVALVAGPGDFRTCLTENGVEFIELSPHEGLLRPLAMAPEFITICRKFKPDVVNAHMVAAALTARLAKVFVPFGLVTTVHNSFDRQSRLMQVGDRVITVSDAVNQEMEAMGIAARKLRTVRNGTIGGKRRPFSPESVFAARRPAIASVAGLHPRKGIHTLIEAFSRVARIVPQAHLYIVGDGPSRAELEAKAGALTCGANIHFLGYVQDPRSVLAATDIFVLASLAEPCGLALIEARQMGCACVATNVGGNPEVLERGAKGKLVPPADSDALANALIGLLSDREERRLFAEAARSGLGAWTVRRMSVETLSVYEEVAKHPAM